ncbi:MAG: DUF4159 domain-containing protein [Phycisphaerae bacterium]|nr:DUF4159 domain-containing protein [Phycisphaerae bacterium]
MTTKNLIASVMLCVALPASAARAAPEAVSVAMLTYGPESMTGRCFSDRFLAVVARESSLRVERGMPKVPLSSDTLAGHRFAVMTGEGSFDLSEEEVRRLRRFVLNGGFVLASAGCSSDAWAASMERAVERALPEFELVDLPPDHPVFHAFFDVQDFISRKRKPVRLRGIEIEGRLVMLFSPQGLNDTNEASGASPATPAEPPPGEGDAGVTGCCCCNGDEIAGAKYLNANALIYSLIQ